MIFKSSTKSLGSASNKAREKSEDEGNSISANKSQRFVSFGNLQAQMQFIPVSGKSTSERVILPSSKKRLQMPALSKIEVIDENFVEDSVCSTSNLRASVKRHKSLAHNQGKSSGFEEEVSITSNAKGLNKPPSSQKQEVRNLDQEI